MRKNFIFRLAPQGLLLIGIFLTGFAPVSWSPAADEASGLPAGLITLKGHTETIYAVAISPDGKTMVTGSFDKTLKLWDLATGTEIKTFGGQAGHQNLVVSAAFSTDGQYLVSGSQDNTAKIWDVPSVHFLQEFVHPDAVAGLALSPDGLKLAGAGQDGIIKIWTPADGKQVFNLIGHQGPVASIAFNGVPAPQGQILVSAGSDGTMRLWNPNTGQLLSAVLAHSAKVTGVVLNPNNNAAYSVSEDGALKFWQLPIAPSRSLPPHGDAVTALVLSSDGNQIASASADKTVRISNFADGKQLVQSSPASAGVLTAALSPALIAGGTADNRLILWNAKDGKVVDQILAHWGPITGLAFHPQNTQLVTSSKDGTIKIWSMPPAAPRALSHPDAVLAAAVSSDGKRLLTGSADKMVRIWNLGSNQVERQFTGHSAAVTAVAVSGNGQTLISGSADQTIRVWDQTNGKEKSIVGAHAGPISSLSLNPAGNQLMSSSLDGTIKLWNLAGAGPKILAHQDLVTCVALSPDGSQLITGSTDKQARLWTLSTGKMERPFAGNSLAVTAVAFGANGTLVAAGGADKSVTVWNAADSKEVKKFPNLPGPVSSIAFHPAAPGNMAQVAAGLADNSIHILDVVQGKATTILKGPAPVNGVEYLPQGDQVISAHANGTVQMWNVADGMAKAKFEFGGALTGFAISRDAARIAVGGADKTVKIWTVADSKLIATIPVGAEIRSVALNADGSRLVVGCADNQARVFGIDGKLQEFFPQEGAVAAVVFHPDGKQIIVAGADKSARICISSLVWQAGHAGPVRQAHFTPKGDRVISVGDDKTVKFWNSTDGKPEKTLAAHEGPVVGFGISADGGKLVTTGGDNKVKIWNLVPPKSGTPLDDKPLSIISLNGPPQSLAISPNGVRLAVAFGANAKSSIGIYDLATGRELMVFPDLAGNIRALAFQGDNRTLFSAGDDKTARLIDVHVAAGFDAHAGGVAGIAMHSNGNQILSGGADKTVKLWNLPGNQQPQVAKTFGPLADAVTAVAFNRDCTQVGAAAGNTVRVWNLADGKELLTLAHRAPVLSISFSVDKTKVVTGSSDNLARVWDVATGRELQAFSQAGPVSSVVFHPNNSMIVSGSGDKTVGIHSLSAVRVITAANGPIRGIAITPNASHVITTEDKEIKLWNIANGTREQRVFAGAQGPIHAVAISKNGVLLASGGADQTVRLYQFADGKLLTQIKVPGPVQRLAFSPNNQSLAAAGADKTLGVWTVLFNPGQPPPADFGKPGPIFSHDAGATDVVFAPDSMRLYSSGLDKKVRAWKFASEVPVKSLGHPNLVDAVAFNAGGTQLASGCHDGSIRIWDVAKGQLIREIKGHTVKDATSIYCIAWSPDNKQIVSGSLDHSLKLWDAASGNLVREFKGYKEKDFEKGHKDGVFCVAFDPQGKFLVSGGSDHTIKVWNVADGAVVHDLSNPKVKVAAGTTASHPGWVYSLRYSPDGTKIISAGNAPRNLGYLAVWNANDGKFLYGEELPLGPIYSIAVSPEGKNLALGCGSKGKLAPESNAYIMKMPEAGK
ncbi:MAG TPA: WD40 repeat domain-containing protein [Gemmataceae bacterium]|nr:WD40 repeat domain-containing protein [Gemmataceae bacterium]